MRQKENQRVKLTKRLLKESLLSLMEKEKVENISVCELCSTAGINRSTFYKHYGKPYDVLADMEQDMINDLSKIWKEKVSGQWTFSKGVELLSTYLKEHARLTKLLLRDRRTDLEFANKLIGSEHVKKMYGRLLTDVKDPESRRLIMTFSTTGAYQMIRQWLLDDSSKSPQELGELAEQMVSIIMKDQGKRQ